MWDGSIERGLRPYNVFVDKHCPLARSRQFREHFTNIVGARSPELLNLSHPTDAGRAGRRAVAEDSRELAIRAFGRAQPLGIVMFEHNDSLRDIRRATKFGNFSFAYADGRIIDRPLEPRLKARSFGAHVFVVGPLDLPKPPPIPLTKLSFRRRRSPMSRDDDVLRLLRGIAAMAAKRIQRAWRWRRQAKAALRLQCLDRRRASRTRVARLRREQRTTNDASLLSCQSASNLRAQQQRQAAIKIQCVMERRVSSCQSASNLRAQQQRQAAIKIQSIMDRRVSSCQSVSNLRAQQQRQAAIKIQSIMDRRVSSCQSVSNLKAQQQRQAAIKIQCVMERRVSSCQSVSNLRAQQQRQAAIKIQSMERRVSSCQSVSNLRAQQQRQAAIKIQSIMERRVSSCQSASNLRAQQQRQAAIKIQCMERRVSSCQSVSNLRAQQQRQAAIKIQSIMDRRVSSCQSVSNLKAQQQRQAAIKIQCLDRRFLSSCAAARTPQERRRASEHRSSSTAQPLSSRLEQQQQQQQMQVVPPMVAAQQEQKPLVEEEDLRANDLHHKDGFFSRQEEALSRLAASVSSRVINASVCHAAELEVGARRKMVRCVADEVVQTLLAAAAGTTERTLALETLPLEAVPKNQIPASGRSDQIVNEAEPPRIASQTVGLRLRSGELVLCEFAAAGDALLVRAVDSRATYAATVPSTTTTTTTGSFEEACWNLAPRLEVANGRLVVGPPLSVSGRVALGAASRGYLVCTFWLDAGTLRVASFPIDGGPQASGVVRAADWVPLGPLDAPGRWREACALLAAHVDDETLLPRLSYLCSARLFGGALCSFWRTPRGIHARAYDGDETFSIDSPWSGSDGSCLDLAQHLEILGGRLSRRAAITTVGGRGGLVCSFWRLNGRLFVRGYDANADRYHTGDLEDASDCRDVASRLVVRRDGSLGIIDEKTSDRATSDDFSRCRGPGRRLGREIAACPASEERAAPAPASPPRPPDTSFFFSSGKEDLSRPVVVSLEATARVVPSEEEEEEEEDCVVVREQEGSFRDDKKLPIDETHGGAEDSSIPRTSRRHHRRRSGGSRLVDLGDDRGLHYVTTSMSAEHGGGVIEAVGAFGGTEVIRLPGDG